MPTISTCKPISSVGNFEDFKMPKEKIDFDSDVSLEDVNRRRKASSKSSKYPFEEMPYGASFHVPVMEDDDKGWATIRGRVNGACTIANNKYSNDESNPKRFKMVAVSEDDPKGIGFRVFCINPNAEVKTTAKTPAKSSSTAKGRSPKRKGVTPRKILK